MEKQTEPKKIVKECGCELEESNEILKGGMRVVKLCKYHDILGVFWCKSCKNPIMIVQFIGTEILIYCDKCDKLKIRISTNIVQVIE